MKIQLNHYRWLIGEVASWKLQDIINTDQANKILDLYEAEEHKKADVLPILIGIIGSLLVGLGIILLLAKNWDILSRESRLVISALPFLLGSILGFLTIKYDRDKWEKEAVGIFISISIVAGLALIGQTYHSVLPEKTLYFTAAILTLPFAYLLRSSLSFMAYILFFTVYSGMSYGQDIVLTITIAGVFGALILPYLIHLEDNNKLFELSWISGFLSVSGFFVIMSTAEKNAYIFETLILYFLIIVLISAFEKKGISFISFAARLGLFLILFIMTFSFFWYDLTNRAMNFSSIIVMSAVVLGFTAIAVQYNRRINTKGTPLMLFGIIPIITSVFRILPSTPIISDIFMWGFNLGFFALGIFVFSQGVKTYSGERHSLVQANFGLFLLLALITKWFFDFDISFLARGILFISLGIGFLAFNFIFIKRRGGVKNEGK